MSSIITRSAWSALILASCAAIAQPQGAPLRLGDVYAEVDRANPRVAAAVALARAAEAKTPGARRPPDPQLQLGFMNYALPSLAPMATVGMVQLQLMQMLPLGGKLSLAGSASAARALAEGERASEVLREQRAAAAMAFYDLYATQRGLEIDRETIRLLQDIEQTASSMYRVGEGRQSDVLRAQVEVARMAADSIRMRSMLAAMAASLDALRGRPAGSGIAVPVLPAFPDSAPALATLQDIAEASRPMIRAGVNEVHAATAGEKLAAKEIWPDLQVGVQYGQRGGEMGTERMGSLMLGASVPVFAKSRQNRMRDEAGAMRLMAEADLAAMRSETRARVASAHAALTRARALSRLYRSTIIPQAEATAASALAAYRVGGVDFMTLLDDRMTVNRYRQELLELEAAEGKAWAELEMLTDRDLIDRQDMGGGR